MTQDACQKALSTLEALLHTNQERREAFQAKVRAFEQQRRAFQSWWAYQQERRKQQIHLASILDETLTRYPFQKRENEQPPQWQPWEVTEQEWRILLTLFPPQRGKGRPKLDSRLVLNGILYHHMNGGPWSGIPPKYGGNITCWRRLLRWQQDGTWTRILAVLQDSRTKNSTREERMLKR